MLRSSCARHFFSTINYCSNAAYCQREDTMSIRSPSNIADPDCSARIRNNHQARAVQRTSDINAQPHATPFPKRSAVPPVNALSHSTAANLSKPPKDHLTRRKYVHTPCSMRHDTAARPQLGGRLCYKVKWIRAVRDQDVVAVLAWKQPHFFAPGLRSFL